MIYRWLFVCIVLLFAWDARCDGQVALRLHPLFTSGMVLQRDMKCNVWGWGKVGDSVSVAFKGESKKAVIDADGRWLVQVGPFNASMEKSVLEVSSEKSGRKITIQNVLVGDVWICGGQSNMIVSLNAFKTHFPDEFKPIIEDQAKYSGLRYCSVADHVNPLREEEEVTFGPAWVEVLPQTSHLIAGLPFFFGRNLYMELGVPIGLINTAIGGTCAEVWCSRQTLMTQPAAQPIMTNWETLQRNYDPEKVRQSEEKRIADIKAKIEAAKGTGDTKLLAQLQSIPLKVAMAPNQSVEYPAGGFNGKIAPLTKFTIKGFIWDQGENNAVRAWQYRQLLPLVISDWRQYWQAGNGSDAKNLPFLMVQIHEWGGWGNDGSDYPKTPPCIGNFGPEIRDAQYFVAVNTPHCDIAVAIDHKERNGDLHTSLKNIPGERLAAIALAKVYGKNICWSGPRYQKMEKAGNKIRVYFEHIEKGLMVGNRRNADTFGTPDENSTLKYFAIAGKDNRFVWANAIIDGDTVLVWSDQLLEPENVRYAWENNPQGCNLYNRNGFPAMPFRTDNLPYATLDATAEYRTGDEPMKTKEGVQRFWSAGNAFYR